MLLVGMGTFVLAQSPSKLKRKGDHFVRKGEFAKAIDYFSKLDSTGQTNDPLVAYYLGVAYFYSPDQREKGIPHLEHYLEVTDTNHQAHFLLGRLYHLNYEFDKAIGEYQEFIDDVEADHLFTAPQKAELHDLAAKEIDHCKFGKIAVKNPRNAIIENLGDEINTRYPEYAGVVSKDERHLIYTSRRPDTEGGKQAPDGQFFEDIYHTNMLKGSLFEARSLDTSQERSFFFTLVTEFEYSEAVKMGGAVNSKSHDGSIQLGGDDEHLYFYRDNNVWLVNIHDTAHTDAEKLGSFVNSEFYEPSIFFSYDGDELFIVSDREGGYGGLDIYVSHKVSDGVWTDPVNMGPTVNTPFDEDAPYLDPDDTTLYFSSKGNSSIGDYDIFRCRRTSDSTWSDPVNLGYPINTPAEDIYFTMTPRYNRGYYASSTLGGVGDMDLYRITFADERDPVAELLGLVLQGNELVPAKSKITMKRAEGEEIISQETDTLSGDYFLLLGHGKTYDMLVETEHFVPYQKQFVIPEQRQYYQLYQEIHHVFLYDSEGNIIGQRITVYNALEQGDSNSVDTLVTYYDPEIMARVNEIKEKDEQRNVEVFSDVKFYMTEDSLKNLMRQDTGLNFDFPGNTTVSFMDGEHPAASKDSLNSYTPFGGSLKREDFILDDETTTADLAARADSLASDNLPEINIILHFDYDHHNVSTTAMRRMDTLVSYLQDYPHLKVEIGGHTDSKGTHAYNFTLSVKRALAAHSYLKSKGISSDRLTYKGHGETQPIAPNEHQNGSDNPSGREANRRVEFTISLKE